MRVSDVMIEGGAVVTFPQLADALYWWDLESGCLTRGEGVLWRSLQGIFFLKKDLCKLNSSALYITHSYQEHSIESSQVQNKEIL